MEAMATLLLITLLIGSLYVAVLINSGPEHIRDIRNRRD